jgi:hypothetical protein
VKLTLGRNLRLLLEIPILIVIQEARNPIILPELPHQTKTEVPADLTVLALPEVLVLPPQVADLIVLPQVVHQNQVQVVQVEALLQEAEENDNLIS